jgi:Ca-activated chloride channel family protein
MLSARVKDLKGNITVQGDMPGEKWNLTLSLKEVGKHKGVATVWARKKIEDLLDAKTTGADKSETRRKVIEVALTHQLVSPYTSFVAVEKTVSRSSNQPAKSKAIPNSKPKGQSAQQFAYPKTATSASLNMCLSLVFFALAVMLHYSRRFCTKPAGGVR